MILLIKKNKLTGGSTIMKKNIVPGKENKNPAKQLYHIKHKKAM